MQDHTTEYLKLKRSIRYRLARFVWVYSGKLSRLAGKYIVRLNTDLDKKLNSTFGD